MTSLLLRKRPDPRKISGHRKIVSLQHPRLQKDASIAKAGAIFTFLPIVVILMIAILLTWRALPILTRYGMRDLLMGRSWRPIKGEFGFFPFIAGTLWVTITALLLAIPPSLLSAIYLAEYAPSFLRSLSKPVLDLLAAIPSVVYGVWGMVAIVPLIQSKIAPFLNRNLGFINVFRSDNATGFSVLAGAIVLAVMITPFIIAVAYEVMRNVPDGTRHASLAVGATRWETIRYVVLPRSSSGILAAIVLGLSRALGETMAVLMVVGNVPRVPSSIIDAAYPLPALIANNYGEMMSIPLYDSALMTAALILLVVVIIFNVASTTLLRRIHAGQS